MSFTIPTRISVLVIARRLHNEVQGSGLVRGAPPDISYDVQSIDSTAFTVLENMTPSDRVVSPEGIQVDIQAASLYSFGTVLVLDGEMRLFVQEGIIFDPCEEPPP